MTTKQKNYHEKWSVSRKKITLLRGGSGKGYWKMNTMTMKKRKKYHDSKFLVWFG